MALDNVRTMDEYRLYGIGGIDRTIYLRNEAMAQEFRAKANGAGRIVIEALKRCNLKAGRIDTLMAYGLLAGKRIGVPQYAVDFRE
jgi:hypothetical protein